MPQPDESKPSEARRAVEQACIEWAADLKALLTGVLRDRELAEDALQRTVLRAIQAADSANPDTLRGWLFRIAVNEARQIRRDYRRESQRRELVAAEKTAAWWTVNTNHQAGDTVDAEEVKQLVKSSLRRLSNNQREVIERRVYCGQQFSEISTEMNVPLGTVLTWMRRALEQLRNDSQLRGVIDPD